MLLLKSSLAQLKKMNKEYRKGKKKEIIDNRLPNIVYIRDIIDDDSSGKHKIDTYDDDIKNTNENMSDKPKKTDNDPSQPMRTIRNMGDYITNNMNSKKERSIMLSGKYVKAGDVLGYVNRIEGQYIFIEDVNTHEIVKMKTKDFIKAYKPEKDATEMTIPGQPVVQDKQTKGNKKNESELMLFDEFISVNENGNIDLE